MNNWKVFIRYKLRRVKIVWFKGNPYQLLDSIYGESMKTNVDRKFVLGFSDLEKYLLKIFVNWLM